MAAVRDEAIDASFDLLRSRRVERDDPMMNWRSTGRSGAVLKGVEDPRRPARTWTSNGRFPARAGEAAPGHERRAFHGMQHSDPTCMASAFCAGGHGIPNPDLVWKDTCCARGMGVDILARPAPRSVDAALPIAEHLLGRMMMHFTVN